MALAAYEAFPSPICGGDAEIHVQGAQGLGLVAQADDEYQECPKGSGAEAGASECIGGPNAEGVAAAVVAGFAVIAEDAPGAAGFPAIVVLGVAVKLAVEDKRSGQLAGGTRGKF